VDLESGGHDLFEQLIEGLAFTTKAVNEKRHELGRAAYGERSWQVWKRKSVWSDFGYNAFGIANDAIRKDMYGIRLPDDVNGGHYRESTPFC
jgi:hypothetical protein